MCVGWAWVRWWWIPVECVLFSYVLWKKWEWEKNSINNGREESEWKDQKIVFFLFVRCFFHHLSTVIVAVVVAGLSLNFYFSPPFLVSRKSSQTTEWWKERNSKNSWVYSSTRHSPHLGDDDDVDGAYAPENDDDTFNLNSLLLKWNFIRLKFIARFYTLFLHQRLAIYKWSVWMRQKKNRKRNVEKRFLWFFEYSPFSS